MTLNKEDDPIEIRRENVSLKRYQTGRYRIHIEKDHLGLATIYFDDIEQTTGVNHFSLLQNRSFVASVDRIALPDEIMISLDRMVNGRELEKPPENPSKWRKWTTGNND